MGYIVNNTNYYTKKHVGDKCKEILTNNKDDVLQDDELDFILDLLKNYPDPDSKNLGDIRRIRVGRHFRFLTLCVMDSTGREREVSYAKAIGNMTWNSEDGDFIDEIDKEDKIRFGKFQGMTFKESVEIDPDYFEWLLGESWVWLKVKARIQEVLENYYNINGKTNKETKIHLNEDLDFDYEPPFDI